MEEPALAIVDSFWAAYYGLEPERLCAVGVRVVPHAGLAGYLGIQAFERGEALVVSVPPQLEERARETLVGWRLERFADPTAVSEALRVEVAAVIGPAVLSYVDERSFQPAPSLWVRRLSPGDREALEALRASCRLSEWEYGGAALEDPCVGWFEEGELLSLAHYVVWGASLAHVGVVTTPAARGRRLGRGVVSAVTGLALAEGLVPQYRTLDSNLPALAVARALGYRPYARTVSVRIAEGARG
jgi:GNAT superfamily N-acetyltransferase